MEGVNYSKASGLHHHPHVPEGLGVFPVPASGLKVLKDA